VKRAGIFALLLLVFQLDQIIRRRVPGVASPVAHAQRGMRFRVRVSQLISPVGHSYLKNAKH
jgi:hypothetical protein